jgi:hypothetical protein
MSGVHSPTAIAIHLNRFYGYCIDEEMLVIYLGNIAESAPLHRSILSLVTG